MSAGKVQDAIDAVNKYLLEAGREGKFYREALELLDEVEQREQIQTWVGTEKLCAGQPKGTSCWMEVTGRPGCYVWNPNLQSNQTPTWTGGCSGGRAQGEGTLKWVCDGGQETYEATGSLEGGKKHGKWFERSADGTEMEGFYENHKPHGNWVWRYKDGTVGGGPWVEDKRHGQWVERYTDGGVGEGPYVEDKRHGQWVIRQADGTVEYITFANGERVQGASRRQSQPAGTTAGGGSCQVPGYPNPPGGVANLGFSWCPASVGMQVRAFALQAAGAQCAIATGSSSTPEQVEARRREIKAACDRLAALGLGNCQCPPGLR